MAMTRKQLRALGLEGNTVEKLIAMHTETVDALKAERDAWREAAQSSEQLKGERDQLLEQMTALECEKEQALGEKQALVCFKEQMEAQAQQREREEALSSALLKEGANPQVIPLLLRTLPETDMRNGEALDAQSLIAPLKEEYGAFFCAPQRLCTEVISPPRASSLTMTREALLAMDTEEINRHWDAVKTALQEVQL